MGRYLDIARSVVSYEINELNETSPNSVCLYRMIEIACRGLSITPGQLPAELEQGGDTVGYAIINGKVAPCGDRGIVMMTGLPPIAIGCRHHTYVGFRVCNNNWTVAGGYSAQPERRDWCKTVS
jgi:hypothetical protein